MVGFSFVLQQTPLAIIAEVPSELIEAFMVALVLVMLPMSLALIFAGVGSGEVLFVVFESDFLHDKINDPAMNKMNR